MHETKIQNLKFHLGVKVFTFGHLEVVSTIRILLEW